VPSDRAARGATPLGSLFSFPNPVNEISARLVASGVLAMCLLTLVFQLKWVTVIIAYGFIARALAGPTLSPLAQLVTRGLAPRLRIAERLVPSPPKRFAQAMGAAVSLSVVVLTALGYWGAAELVLVLMVVFAFLESALGFCVGCKAFAAMMRAGFIPSDVCEQCSNVGMASSTR
jgi:hypothetical protein